MIELDEKTLPLAIGKVLELNNYSVKYSVKVNGAEVDIVATPEGRPFDAVLYIEATVQYVDNTKYGKDATKFLLVQKSGGQCLSVSTKGFTPDVIERAGPSGIKCLTYEAFFSSFEKFNTYVELVSENPAIQALLETYEEPYFKDDSGEELATHWLKKWKVDQSLSPWLVVLGEYGTGKTALTQKIQSEWIHDYLLDPSQPIPLRIELRNFTRQFDARSLIHHFLDTNKLGHMPIDFVFHLIRNRRVILVLDGYDEMAQFLNARERRTCLAALADLAAEGAKGILTSRPNYFTETEELHVFEALYASLEQNKYHLGQLDKVYIAGERSVDQLLEKYVLNKKERFLRDLTPEQTNTLIKRKLHGDEDGQKIISALLSKIFREEVDGRKQSLSGKPVIVSYLLELIDEIRVSDDEEHASNLGEWQIYKLIVDRLMMRDLQRSPLMPPTDRREALQRLALILSKKDKAVAGEQEFSEIIAEQFKSTLRRLSGEERRTKQDELFQDLRSSATLTRTEAGREKVGWVFSHNSLREYLVTELCVGNMLKNSPLEAEFPITKPMQSFVASLSQSSASSFLSTLGEQWSRKQSRNLGAYLGLSSDLLVLQEGGFAKSLSKIVGKAGGGIDFDGIGLRGYDLAAYSDKKKFLISARDSSLVDVSFRGLDLSDSDFTSATIDNVFFSGSVLHRADFQKCWIFECDLSDAKVDGANFRGLDSDSTFIVRRGGEAIVLEGARAIGWLRFHGALTDDVDPFFELQHHEKFSIVFKICEHIAEQRNSQLRGLTQRGVAQSDPPFARAFVNALRGAGLIEAVRNDLVSPTSEGRRQMTRMLNHEEMPSMIEDFLRSN
jgi:Uncharacterized low-complexity proteins